MKIDYFISYVTTKNNQTIFGQEVLTADGEITTDNIVEINELIQEKFGLDKVVILNFIKINSK